MTAAIPADIIAAMRDPSSFGAWFEGPTWNAWHVALKGAFAAPMTDAEREFFHLIAEREPPTKPVSEFWAIVGRGGGKDSVASFVTAHIASSFARPQPDSAWGRFTSKLRKGERAMVACLACSRDQAQIALRMTKSFFDEIPALKKMVKRETRDGFELSNGVDVVVATNDYRSIRGRGVLAVVLDECAFYRDDTSLNPDEELYRALLPGLARVPGSLLIGISSAYKKSGLLYRKFEQNFGVDRDDILVVRAATQVMNPSIDPASISRAMQEDPVGSAAEWLSEFREDISGFVLLEVVNGCTVFGVTERPPVDGVTFSLFFDAAGGGSGGDSAAVAVAHKDHDQNKLVLDHLREFKPPFSASAVIDAIADTADRYGITDCWGDNFAKGFVGERLRDRGKRFCQAPLPKSGIYAELLSWLNSYRCVLIDSPRLRAQLLSLDRRPGAFGKDIIEHPRRLDARDDAANAACGALVQCAAAARRNRVAAVALGTEGVVMSGQYLPSGGWLPPPPPPPGTPLDHTWHEEEGRYRRPWIDPNSR